MQRGLHISLGENYHVYNRGVEKRRIFCERQGYERFLRLLFLANGTSPIKYDRVRGKLLGDINRGKPIVAIGAYALMPNHFHLLIKEVIEGGVSSFMEKLTTAYATYFNKSNERVGSLFQGTYKAGHVKEDDYLKYLFSYIHLNPVKLVEPDWRERGVTNLAAVESFLKRYRYSSYLDYLGIQREETLILERAAFPTYFPNHHTFEEFINEWLTYQNV